MILPTAVYAVWTCQAFFSCDLRFTASGALLTSGRFAPGVNLLIDFSGRVLLHLRERFASALQTRPVRSEVKSARVVEIEPTIFEGVVPGTCEKTPFFTQ